MAEPAQVLPAPADPVADAAALFRAQREPEPVAVRDDSGRFAKVEAPVGEEIEVEQSAEVEAEPDGEVEAAEEAQPEPVQMPASWSKEDAEHWNALSPELQAVVVEREGQREAAVNSKFQEAANARKATEAQLAEANANRDAYAEAINTVLSMVSPVEPDPRQYGAGTGNYDREAYDLAVLQYRQTIGTIDSLKQQQNALLEAQREEIERVEATQYAQIEERSRPALLAAVPDIADPVKAEGALQDIVKYAVSQGIPEDVFTDPDNAKRVTSAELLLAWKAKEYDRLQEAKARVAPKAITTAPPVRPGVSTPRQTQQTVAFQKDMKRLAATGTIEDGASIFKHFRKG